MLYLVDFCTSELESQMGDPHDNRVWYVATTLALLPTHKDQHHHEKTYQKNRNFNALQTTLYNGKI